MGYTLSSPDWTLTSTRHNHKTMVRETIKVDIKVDRDGSTAYAQAVLRDGESFDCTSGFVAIERNPFTNAITRVTVAERFAKVPVVVHARTIKDAVDAFGSAVAARLVDQYFG